MLESVRWWLVLQVVGLALLPLCLTTLSRLPDRGYALSKPFALLILGYVFWLLNSLHLLPNSRTGISAAMALLVAIGVATAYPKRRELVHWAREHLRYIFAVEGLLLVTFAVAVTLRAQVGQISGSEQPMDFMFLNATTRAAHFPPQDPWLSGHTVAYYYFGYLIVAMTARLAFVPTDVAYNIGLAMIAALAVTGATGLAGNLIRLGEAAPEPAADPASNEDTPAGDPADDHPLPAVASPVLTTPRLLFGVAAGLLLAVLGNLVYVFHFASAYGIGGQRFYTWLDVEHLTAHEARATWYPSRYYAFFDASRIYPSTVTRIGASRVISEFPNFSFVLGDLHPHVMALPFGLLALGVAFALFRSDIGLDLRSWRREPVSLVTAAVVVGGLGFLNTWDLPTMAFVVVSVVLSCNLMRGDRSLVQLGLRTAGFALPFIAVAVLAYAPFYLSFDSQADGIWPVVKDTAVQYPGTRLVHLFLYWGLLFAITIPFVFATIARNRRRVTPVACIVCAAVPVLLIVAWALLVVGARHLDSTQLQGAGDLLSQIRDRGKGWRTDALLGLFLSSALLALWLELLPKDTRPTARRREPQILALLLIAISLLLIFGTQFFYLGDVFHTRGNTVFKLYYQAWAMLSVASGFVLYQIFARRLRGPRGAWAAAVGLLTLCAALYPLGATYDRISPYGDDGQQLATAGEIHGLRYLLPDEQDAIAWLNQRAQGQSFVIAETVRDVNGLSDYGASGRFSGSTGIPTIVGWPGHEDQWRGGDSSARSNRAQEVAEIYVTPNLSRAMDLLHKYDVRYLIVGEVERRTYQKAALAKFEVLPIEFRSGNVVIYDARGSAATVRGK